MVAAIDGGAGNARVTRSEALIDRALGHDVVVRLAALAVKAPLRVLAYHDILHAAGFEAQMEHVLHRYRPVSSEEVLRWLDGGSLAPRAVWVTFDDGDPTVVEQALPILMKLGVPATMFICPGMIDTDRPYWWQIVEKVGSSEVARLKQAPDTERIARTVEVEEELKAIHGGEVSRSQLTSDQLGRWLDSGRDIGNHTWDHPMLDRCDPTEQERQIRMAHDWILDRVGPERLLFAYPNGNAVAHSEGLLADLGYQLSVMFDHRMASATRRSHLSRLRTNADADLARFRAIVSGVHPAIHRLRGGR